MHMGSTDIVLHLSALVKAGDGQGGESADSKGSGNDCCECDHDFTPSWGLLKMLKGLIWWVHWESNPEPTD